MHKYFHDTITCNSDIFKRAYIDLDVTGKGCANDIMCVGCLMGENRTRWRAFRLGSGCNTCGRRAERKEWVATASDCRAGLNSFNSALREPWERDCRSPALAKSILVLAPAPFQSVADNSSGQCGLVYYYGNHGYCTQGEPCNQRAHKARL